MRKVSLLCLLGLIATAPVMSVAETKPNGETEVYSDAITMVVEELGTNEQFNVTKFLEEIEKVMTGGQTLTQKRVFDACFESYTSTKSGMDKVTEITNFCTDFDAKLVKAQAKVQKDMEERIRQAKQFAAEGDAKPILYHSKGDANERYGVYKTKYGYAVYTTKTKNKGKLGVNDAKEFVCFLGDEGTENCNTNKSCVASSAVKSNKYGVVFVCGSSANSYASLKDGFSVYKNNKDGAVFSQFSLTAQTGTDQLTLIENNVIKEVQGNKEQAVEQEKPECPKGQGYPSEVAAGCAVGICKMDLTQCYPIEQIKCFEAAALGDPANWTGKECNCGDLKEWDPYTARCIVKKSNRQKLVEAGASAERLACYDAGKDTKWEGDVKQGTCTCVDVTKVWNAQTKTCEIKQKTPEEIAQENCEKRSDVATWNGTECKCKDAMLVWDGYSCKDDPNNCDREFQNIRVRTLETNFNYVSPESRKYMEYSSDVQTLKNAYNALKALAPADRKGAYCDTIKTLPNKIDEELHWLRLVDDNVAQVKTMGASGMNWEYDMWYATSRSGKPERKRVASLSEAMDDARWNYSYMVMHGTLPSAYDYIRDFNEASALARDAQDYLGGNIQCKSGNTGPLTCRAVGDDRIDCFVQKEQKRNNEYPIKMTFVYDSICANDVYSVRQQKGDNRK